MAFKMTPGMKGSPESNSIMKGNCGGPNQPPCPPRFQAEKTTERAPDRSFRARTAGLKKKAVVAPTKPTPVKLKINLPKGYEFDSKLLEASFYDAFSDLSGFKSQEELDAAVMKRLKAAPSKPTPIEGPVLEAPIVKPAPIKGEASEAVISKPKVKAVAAK